MIRMRAAVMVLAFVGATSASVNVTFQNHSHVVVSLQTRVPTRMILVSMTMGLPLCCRQPPS
jgi:hypothetical protein